MRRDLSRELTRQRRLEAVERIIPAPIDASSPTLTLLIFSPGHGGRLRGAGLQKASPDLRREVGHGARLVLAKDGVRILRCPDVPNRVEILRHHHHLHDGLFQVKAMVGIDTYTQQRKHRVSGRPCPCVRLSDDLE